MKVTGMNRTTEQRNLLRIYSIDKKGDNDMAEFDYEVVNGRKIRVRPVETVSEVDENGYFVRQPNRFTEGFGERKNPVEAGRYRLVWAKLCHWSNRASSHMQEICIRSRHSGTIHISRILQHQKILHMHRRITGRMYITTSLYRRRTGIPSGVSRPEEKH